MILRVLLACSLFFVPSPLWPATTVYPCPIRAQGELLAIENEGGAFIIVLINSQSREIVCTPWQGQQATMGPPPTYPFEKRPTGAL